MTAAFWTHLARSTVAGAALVAAGLTATSAHALTIDLNDDVAAGQLAYAPSLAVMLWSNMFPQATTWEAGTLGARIQATSVTDAATGSIAVGAIHLGNWIDGPGFDLPGSAEAWPDLALDGVESFTLHFTTRVRGIGLAVATGLSNLPSEVDHAGASFRVQTDRGEWASLTLTDDGAGHAAWVRIDADLPFKSITFTELDLNPADQYFGSVLAMPVPEPGGLPLMAAGLGASLLWLTWRRRIA